MEATIGKLACATAATVLHRGWAAFVETVRGVSNLAEGVVNLPYRAARLLAHLRKRSAGVPMTTAPWGEAQCDVAIMVP